MMRVFPLRLWSTVGYKNGISSIPQAITADLEEVAFASFARCRDPSALKLSGANDVSFLVVGRGRNVSKLAILKSILSTWQALMTTLLRIQVEWEELLMSTFLSL